MKLFGKKSKVLAAAIAMMTLSTAAAVTGTVAWFTANNIVTASGMNIQAEAENGIVISNEGKSDWKTTATATHNSVVGVIPTSTENAETWYHANSDDANNYAQVGGYTSYAVDGTDPVKPITVSNGVGSASVNGNTRNLYLINHFFIQSANANSLTNQDIYIKKVDAVSGSSSVELDKSLRILVEQTGNTDASKTMIYSPVYSAAAYSVNGGASLTPKTAGDEKTDVIYTGNIVGYTAAGTGALDISVFVYFEGEDPNCKSANIKETLDKLQVSLQFANRQHS